ncbi:hypothetical protein PUN28_002043 [Cardiocondyla obscurior]|uniref:Uncharacterized protein n=1 Tax=Cardiocondyla obscurior TaxID=286306 RepID=A0AAW2GSJ2_9HYME
MKTYLILFIHIFKIKNNNNKTKKNRPITGLCCNLDYFCDLKNYCKFITVTSVMSDAVCIACLLFIKQSLQNII